MNKHLKVVICGFIFLGMLVYPALAADDSPMKIIGKDGAVRNASSSSGGSGSVVMDKDIKNTEEKKDSSDELSADKIYSDDYVLGFKKGTGSFNDVFNTKESMKVISSNAIIWALIVVFFLIGLGLCVLGYFGGTLWNTIVMLYANIFNENPKEAMETVHTRRRGTRRITFALGEFFVLVAVMSFFIFNPPW